MADNEKALVLASLIGDSLARGVHWIYSFRRIAEKFGRVDAFLKPQPDSSHHTKDRGEFTHRWQALFEDYSGCYGQATKAYSVQLFPRCIPGGIRLFSP